MNVSLFFDKSFADKVSRQIFWMFFIILGCLSLLLAVSYFVNEDATITERIVEIFSIFVDTGGVWKSHDGELIFPPIFVWITTTLGITLLSGVLVSIVTNMLTRREAHYLSGDTIYSLNNHFVVFGYNEMAKSLIIELCKSTNQGGMNATSILLITSQDVHSVRFSLKAELYTEYDNVIIKHGRRDNEYDLSRLKINKARGIYILGDKGEVDHDSLNIKNINLIASIMGGTKKRIPCYVVFDHQISHVAFQTAHVDSRWNVCLDFRPINIHEEWAKRVFLSKTMVELYEQLNESSSKHIRIVIYGMNKTGIALGLEAGQICHFPNYKYGFETIVTFIDDNAYQEMNYFRGRMRSYFEIMGTEYIDAETGSKTIIGPTKFEGSDSGFLDVKYEFIKGSSEMSEIQDMVKLWNKDPNELTVLAICYEDYSRSLAASLYLPFEVYEGDTKVFIYQKYSSDLIQAILQSKKYRNFRPFGMVDEWMTIKQLSLTGGKIVNAIYEGDEINMDSIWENTSLVSQWSSLYCADHIVVKMASIGFEDNMTSEYMNLFCRVEHNRWNMEKLIMGFRKASEGEQDDKINFLVHNDIKPFDKLPAHKKEIDERIVKKIPQIYGAIMW